jgi:tRNA pseudouridine55 synthase
MNGFLNIHKPAQMTSFDVVARVRRICKTKRAGHAGTLDPDAIGVLVVAVGQATRLLPYLPTEPKVYTARIAFGVATDTEDASGTETARANASHLTEADVHVILARFVGDIAQTPPMVSAVHHEGRRLYELAREGKVVERAARTVTIHSVALSDFAPGEVAEATLRVVCGGGTYIRTLCVDIGQAVGLPAHMKHLVREAVGPFAINEAVSLEDLQTFGASALRSCFVSMEQALGFPALDVSDADALRLSRGQTVRVDETEAIADGATVALLNRGGLRALVKRDGDVFAPFRVFEAERGEL